jgi:hypothetical protein
MSIEENKNDWGSCLIKIIIGIVLLLVGGFLIQLTSSVGLSFFVTVGLIFLFIALLQA